MSRKITWNAFFCASSTPYEGSNLIGDPPNVLAPKLTLPHNLDAPPDLLKLQAGPLIASDVPVKLFLPERGVRLWQVGDLAALVVVPEATMHEYDNASAAEYDVWFPWQVLIAERIAKAQCMQRLAESEFG
jgi:hypothetical protein